MRQRQRVEVAGGKVAFEAIEGRQGGTGIFGLEEKADELARQAKLRSIAEEIAAYDCGYEGPHRRCPRCGQEQRYKGDVSRVLVFDCGTVRVRRACYVCPACRQASYPLAEQLGLAEEHEQGWLREKLAAKIPGESAWDIALPAIRATITGWSPEETAKVEAVLAARVA